MCWVYLNPLYHAVAPDHHCPCTSGLGGFPELSECKWLAWFNLVVSNSLSWSPGPKYWSKEEPLGLTKPLLVGKIPSSLRADKSQSLLSETGEHTANIISSPIPAYLQPQWQIAVADLFVQKRCQRCVLAHVNQDGKNSVIGHRIPLHFVHSLGSVAAYLASQTGFLQFPFLRGKQEELHGLCQC